MVFVKKENDGEWEFKDINRTCEFCGAAQCNRMSFKDSFAKVLDNVHTSTEMQNNEHRHFGILRTLVFIYKANTHKPNGFLMMDGKGMRL